MGYTTNFDGSLKLSKNLTEEQFKYIELFNETRRMKRDVNKLMEMYDGKHGYPGRTGTPQEIYGNDGEYFVGGARRELTVEDGRVGAAGVGRVGAAAEPDDGRVQLRAYQRLG